MIKKYGLLPENFTGNKKYAILGHLGLHIVRGISAPSLSFIGQIWFVVNNDTVLVCHGLLLLWGIVVGWINCLVLGHIKSDGLSKFLVAYMSLTTSTCWSPSMPQSV
jgi:ABC-type transporter Mla maintaining outer membrane lipid asymmetry permease subunit MlaE